MATNILHYDLISEFKKVYFAKLLTHEHITSNKIHIPKLLCRDGVTEEYDFWGYTFEKNNVKYLVSSDNEDGSSTDIREMLPIVPEGCLEVANKGIVYQWVRNPISVKFKPIKTMTFKQFIDLLTGLNHSNKMHQKLCMFMGITQMFNRANFRISTPAGFGKDSTVDIIGNLFGGSATIENPSVAKLEDRACILKWLAVNEVVDITTAQLRDIEQILLSMGAHKPEVTKRTKKHGNVGETIDISNFSLSLMYNDIDHYPDVKKYFDNVCKKAVRDRFPAFRLYGQFTEDFNSVIGLNINSFVNDNISKYKEVIYNYNYYKQNYMKYIHNYPITNLLPLTKRWMTNIEKLLMLIDCYCDTQEEFNQWINVVNASITDYSDMLDYPIELLDFAKRTKVPDDMNTSITKIMSFCQLFGYKNEKWCDARLEHLYNYCIDIKKSETFTKKNNLMRLYKYEEKSGIVHDVRFW